jgi:hypothetical protein
MWKKVKITAPYCILNGKIRSFYTLGLYLLTQRCIIRQGVYTVFLIDPWFGFVRGNHMCTLYKHRGRRIAFSGLWDKVKGRGNFRTLFCIICQYFTIRTATCANINCISSNKSWDTACNLLGRSTNHRAIYSVDGGWRAKSVGGCTRGYLVNSLFSRFSQKLAFAFHWRNDFKLCWVSLLS